MGIRKRVARFVLALSSLQPYRSLKKTVFDFGESPNCRLIAVLGEELLISDAQHGGLVRDLVRADVAAQRLRIERDFVSDVLRNAKGARRLTSVMR